MFKTRRLVCKLYRIILTSFKVHVPGGVEVVEYSITFSMPYLSQFFITLRNLVFLSSFYSCGIEGSEKLNSSLK